MGSQHAVPGVLVPELPGTATPAGGPSGWPAVLAGKAMRVLWLWPALLMLAVGCYQLTVPDLWRDELSSWSFASRPVPELMAVVRRSDASQLAYYLLLHYWMAAFGYSVLAMRMLSVLAMTAAAACVTLAARKLAGSGAAAGRAGLLAGLAFVLIPSVSRFAQEARFYAFEVFAAMLATWLLLRALERSSVNRWAVYGCSVVLLGYADLVALSVLAGHAVAVGLRWRQERRLYVLAFVPAAVAGCLACLPLARVGLGQANSQVGWVPRPSLSLWTFDFFSRNLFYSGSAAAALIIVAVLAWAVVWRAAAVASAIAVVPVAVVWLLSQGQTSYFFPRYLLFTVGAWAILAGIALSKLDMRVAAAAVLVFGILGAHDQQVIREPGAHNWATYPVSESVKYWDYSGAAAIIARQVRPGDGIVYPGVPITWAMINYGVQYYLRQSLPADRVPRQVFVSVTAAQAGALYPDLCAHPARCLGQAPRVWVVTSGHAATPYREIPGDEIAVLRARYRVIQTARVPGLTITLLQRTP
jgi:mannosyltransferase